VSRFSIRCQSRNFSDTDHGRHAPHLVDHSGFDAYALEIEADERRLFYSGDLRAHGRKSKLFELMLKRPPKNIDVMLMEGSSLGRIDGSECFPTEEKLERIFIERFKITPGILRRWRMRRTENAAGNDQQLITPRALPPR
jgi:hypothetical protein